MTTISHSPTAMQKNRDASIAFKQAESSNQTLAMIINPFEVGVVDGYNVFSRAKASMTDYLDALNLTLEQAKQLDAENEYIEFHLADFAEQSFTFNVNTPIEFVEDGIFLATDIYGKKYQIIIDYRI